MDINPGFHGDDYLRKVVWFCLKKSKYFVETGMAFGNSLMAVCNHFPSVKPFSCEPSKKYDAAIKRFTKIPRVTILNKESPDALYDFLEMQPDMASHNTVFWLDAHDDSGKFIWPLRKEIEFITSKFLRPFIFIDDFLVPGKRKFGHDSYHGQACSFDYIEDSIKVEGFNLVYPAYTERTSKHHPLRGWCLIEYGHCDFKLKQKFRVESTVR